MVEKFQEESVLRREEREDMKRERNKLKRTKNIDGGMGNRIVEKNPEEKDKTDSIGATRRIDSKGLKNL